MKNTENQDAQKYQLPVSIKVTEITEIAQYMIKDGETRTEKTLPLIQLIACNLQQSTEIRLEDANTDGQSMLIRVKNAGRRLKAT